MTSMPTKRVPVVLAGLLALFTSTCVQASSFTVSPTRIPLSAKHRAVTVRLLNLGDEPLTLQAHVVAWTTNENRDLYQDNDDVVLNPPIVTLEPQKPQLMRLGLRRPYVEGAEFAYRLNCARGTPSSQARGRGLKNDIAHHGTDLCRTARRSPQAVGLEGGACPRRRLKITATNNGNVHVQIRHLDLFPETSLAAPSRLTVLDYLLPGQTHAWIFEDAKFRAVQNLALTVVTDAESFRVSLVPTSR